MAGGGWCPEEVRRERDLREEDERSRGITGWK